MSLIVLHLGVVQLKQLQLVCQSAAHAVLWRVTGVWLHCLQLFFASLLHSRAQDGLQLRSSCCCQSDVGFHQLLWPVWICTNNDSHRVLLNRSCQTSCGGAGVDSASGNFEGIHADCTAVEWTVLAATWRAYTLIVQQ